MSTPLVDVVIASNQEYTLALKELGYVQDDTVLATVTNADLLRDKTVIGPEDHPLRSVARIWIIVRLKPDAPAERVRTVEDYIQYLDEPEVYLKL